MRAANRISRIIPKEWGKRSRNWRREDRTLQLFTSPDSTYCSLFSLFFSRCISTSSLSSSSHVSGSVEGLVVGVDDELLRLFRRARKDDLFDFLSHSANENQILPLTNYIYQVFHSSLTPYELSRLLIHTYQVSIHPHSLLFSIFQTMISLPNYIHNPEIYQLLLPLFVESSRSSCYLPILDYYIERNTGLDASSCYFALKGCALIHDWRRAVSIYERYKEDVSIKYRPIVQSTTHTILTALKPDLEEQPTQRKFSFFGLDETEVSNNSASSATSPTTPFSLGHFIQMIRSIQYSPYSDNTMSILSDLYRHDIVPNEKFFTSLLSTLSSAAPVQWKNAIQVLDEIRKNGFIPSEQQYLQVILACAKGGEVQLSMSMLEEIKSSYHPYRAPAAVYETEVLVYELNGDYEAGRLLQSSMSTHHIPLNRWSYHSLIKQAWNQRDFQRIYDLFDTVKTKNDLHADPKINSRIIYAVVEWKKKLGIKEDILLPKQAQDGGRSKGMTQIQTNQTDGEGIQIAPENLKNPSTDTTTTTTTGSTSLSSDDRYAKFEFDPFRISPSLFAHFAALRNDPLTSILHLPLFTLYHTYFYRRLSALGYWVLIQPYQEKEIDVNELSDHDWFAGVANRWVQIATTPIRKEEGKIGVLPAWEIGRMKMQLDNEPLTHREKKHEDHSIRSNYLFFLPSHCNSIVYEIELFPADFIDIYSIFHILLRSLFLSAVRPYRTRHLYSITKWHEHLEEMIGCLDNVVISTGKVEVTGKEKEEWEKWKIENKWEELKKKLNRKVKVRSKQETEGERVNVEEDLKAIQLEQEEVAGDSITTEKTSDSKPSSIPRPTENSVYLTEEEERVLQAQLPPPPSTHSDESILPTPPAPTLPLLISTSSLTYELRKAIHKFNSLLDSIKAALSRRVDRPPSADQPQQSSTTSSTSSINLHLQTGEEDSPSLPITNSTVTSSVINSSATPLPATHFSLNSTTDIAHEHNSPVIDYSPPQPLSFSEASTATSTLSSLESLLSSIDLHSSFHSLPRPAVSHLMRYEIREMLRNYYGIDSHFDTTNEARLFIFSSELIAWVKREVKNRDERKLQREKIRNQKKNKITVVEKIVQSRNRNKEKIQTRKNTNHSLSSIKI